MLKNEGINNGSIFLGHLEPKLRRVHRGGSATYYKRIISDDAQNSVTYFPICHLSTNSNTAIDGTITEVDGTALSSGDLILLTGQTDLTENNVYEVPTDGTAWVVYPNIAPGMYVSVYDGTTYDDTLWSLTSGDGLSTTEKTFEEMFLYRRADDFTRFSQNTSLNASDKFLIENNSTGVKEYAVLNNISDVIDALPAGTEHQTLRKGSSNWEASSTLKTHSNYVVIVQDGSLSADNTDETLYLQRDLTLNTYDATGAMLRVDNASGASGPFMDALNDSALVVYNLSSTGSGYFADDVGIKTDTPNAVLEVEDNGTSHDTVFKITLDNAADAYAQIIGNDTFSTFDEDGLRFLLDDTGRTTIENRKSSEDPDEYHPIYFQPSGGMVGIGVAPATGLTELLTVDGVCRANSGFQYSAAAGVSGTLTYDDGVLGRFVLVFQGGILTSGSVVASTGATMTWV